MADLTTLLAKFLEDLYAGTITVPSPGVLQVTLLQVGGATSSFPALRRNGAQLQAVLADESALAAFTAASVSAVAVAASVRFQLTPLAFGALRVGAGGDVAFVTDSNTGGPGGTAAGGGANNVLVFYNGTNWIVA